MFLYLRIYLCRLDASLVDADWTVSHTLNVNSVKSQTQLEGAQSSGPGDTRPVPAVNPALTRASPAPPGTCTRLHAALWVLNIVYMEL